jgi:hypothetical protein
MDRSSSQCPNCHRWFSNRHSILIHLSSCWQKYDNKEHEHGIFEHNPLKSSYDFCKSTNDKGLNEPIVNDQCGKQFKRKTTDDYEMSFSSPTCNNTDITNDDIDGESLDYDNFNGNYYDPQSQPSTAVSKVQITLNNLINNHKAPLKLYDNIVHLFNEYILSDNFDQFAKLKSRKSFIQSMESSYRVTHLWPKNRDVMLHDGSEVTVPVLDAQCLHWRR